MDQFTERQIRAVIGHELGHIRCQHTFYRSVAQGFAPVAALAATFPGGTLLALALQWHLLDWYRKSELSSDRFGLLVTGDLEAVQGVMVQFAGGSTSVREELSTDEFRRQANEFRDSVESRKHGSLRDRIEYYVSDLMLETTVSTHPWPAIRFVEIEDWANSPQYHHIARGDLDAAERHPFQYLPETVDEDDVDISEDGSPERGGPIAGGPVLRQAASEVVGAFKNWTAKPAPFGSHPQSRSSTSPPVTPANWYPDPNGTDQLRWWDGSTWTDKVRPS